MTKKPIKIAYLMFIWGIAVGFVTALYYALRFIRTTYPNAIFPAYCTLFVLLALGGYIVFHRHTPRSYRQYGQLTHLTQLLSCIVWGAFYAFPSIYSPYNWAWSWSTQVSIPGSVKWLSGLLIITGITGTVFSFFQLGIFKSIGDAPVRLTTTGIYRLTRNPQIVAGSFIVLGYTLLRPSLYATGWMILYAFISHLMVSSEENYLKKNFKEEYKQYCAKTRRYI